MSRTEMNQVFLPSFGRITKRKSFNAICHSFEMFNPIEHKIDINKVPTPNTDMVLGALFVLANFARRNKRYPNINLPIVNILGDPSFK